VRALERTAAEAKVPAPLLQAVESVNHQQKEVLFEKLSAYFDGELHGKTFALWGLAFKPNTDDMREASSRRLMEQLWQAGAQVRAFDPVALEEAGRLYGTRTDLALIENQMDCLAGADALIIVTEWNQFRSPDFATIRSQLNTPVIFDGRNIFDPAQVLGAGLDYVSIGRQPKRASPASATH
jgi:UDPglucose 6-dehydrogenase